jgi:hypothetical protein
MMLREAAVIQFNVLSRLLRGTSKDNHENLSKADLRAGFWTQDVPEYEALVLTANQQVDLNVGIPYMKWQ